MRSINRVLSACILLGGLFLTAVPARAEMLEEIVAWVNGHIITSSDLEMEEQAMVAEIYRRYTGEELDREMKNLNESLLLEMIDRKILISKAQMLFDVEKMGEVFYEGFLEQQDINDEEELQSALAREGLTIETLKERLIEMFAPDEVLRNEVGSRVAVSDGEATTYYEENTDKFIRPAEATIREIVLLADTEAKRESRRTEADRVREMAVETDDFGELAKEVSEAGTAAEGGLLGPLERGQLSEQLDAVAFSLPVGEVSEVLEAPYGFHIVFVESRTDEALAPLEEVLEDLRRFLENVKYFEARSTYMKKARGEAEWCVKPKYADRLPEGMPNQTCPSL